MIEDLVGPLEPALWRVAERAYGSAVRSQRALCAAVTELSRLYTSDRQALAHTAAPELLLARLLFFTVADLPKAVFPLAELQSRGALPAPAGPLRVLDLGSGCGTMSLGLLALLARVRPQAALQLEAIDHDPAALALMGQAVDEARAALVYRGELDWQPSCQDAGRPTLGQRSYHLVLAGSLLNELPAGSRQALCQRLLELLAPGGQLLLVEPALRESARGLHRLRDALLADGATVFAPCTRQGSCPSLACESDWCHEHRRWQPPPQLRALAQATGLRRRDIKWSYVTLNREGVRSVGAEEQAFRAVSAPLLSKGKQEHILCGQPGWLRLGLLKRHRSPANRSFAELDRGLLARFAPPLAAEGVGRQPGLRLATDQRVELEDLAAEGLQGRVD